MLLLLYQGNSSKERVEGVTGHPSVDPPCSCDSFVLSEKEKKREKERKFKKGKVVGKIKNLRPSLNVAFYMGRIELPN